MVTKLQSVMVADVCGYVVDFVELIKAGFDLFVEFQGSNTWNQEETCHTGLLPFVLSLTYVRGSSRY